MRSGGGRGSAVSSSLPTPDPLLLPGLLKMSLASQEFWPRLQMHQQSAVRRWAAAAMTARVEAQEAEKPEAIPCGAWADIGGEAVTTIDAAQARLEQCSVAAATGGGSGSNRTQWQLPPVGGHVYSHNSSSSSSSSSGSGGGGAIPVATLFGRPGSADFALWDELLRAAAAAGRCRYVLNPTWGGMPACARGGGGGGGWDYGASAPRVQLAGYGVELALKSTEYKSGDLSASASAAAPGSDETAAEGGEVTTPAQEGDTEGPVELQPVADSTQLGLRATAAVLAAAGGGGGGPSAGLRALRELGGRFPVVGGRMIDPIDADAAGPTQHILAAIAANERLLAMAGVAEEPSSMSSLPEGGPGSSGGASPSGASSPLLAVNGVRLPAGAPGSPLDYYELLAQLRYQRRTFVALQTLGLRSAHVAGLLKPTKGHAQRAAARRKPVRYDLRPLLSNGRDSKSKADHDGHVAWANDLRTEPYADSWPQSLDEAFGITGMMAMGMAGTVGTRVRANAVNVVVIANLGTPGGLFALATLGELLDGAVAARLGVIALSRLPTRAQVLRSASHDGVNPGTDHDEGLGDKLASTFRAIEAKLGCRQALVWARRLQAECELAPGDPHAGVSSSEQPRLLSTVPRRMPSNKQVKDVTAAFLKQHRKAKAAVKKLMKAEASRVAETTAIAAVNWMGIHGSPVLLINGQLHIGVAAVAQLPSLISTQSKIVADELSAGQLTSATPDPLAALLDSRLCVRLPRVPIGAGEVESRSRYTVPSALSRPFGELVLLASGDSDRYISASNASDGGIATVTAWVVADPTSAAGKHLISLVRRWSAADNKLRVAMWMNPAQHAAADVLAEVENMVGVPAGSSVRDSLWVQDQLGLQPGVTAIMLNGRWVPGVGREDEPLLLPDLQALAEIERIEWARPAVEMLTKAKGLKVAWKTIVQAKGSSFGSDVVAAVVAAQRQEDVLVLPKKLKDAAVLKIPAEAKKAVMDVTAVVDPLSTGAHEVATLIAHLQAAIPGAVSASIVLQPPLHLHQRAAAPGSMPLQLLYDYRLPDLAALSAAANKSATATTALRLPGNSTITANLRVPKSWAIELAESNADLDNLVTPVTTTDGGKVQPLVARARYQLASVLLSGQCGASSPAADSTSNDDTATRGVEILLGTGAQIHQTDTVVMDGYFQLRAWFGGYVLYSGSAGWSVSAPTTSLQLSVSSSLPPVSVPALSSALDSFRPRQAQHALAISQTASQPTGWKRLSRLRHEQQSVDTIHIFSLASGQLYERLLKVMMLSVRRHTRAPLKFWLLANYASPAFRLAAPALGKRMSFEVQFVTYNWPPFVRRQTEKQRILWACEC
eukprot:COSAG01_NODE_808_length_13418_cov_9.469631_2_plen_1344_part_00